MRTTVQTKKTIPVQGSNIKFGEYDCIVQVIDHKREIIKLVPDYLANNPLPQAYFWVGFNNLKIN